MRPSTRLSAPRATRLSAAAEEVEAADIAEAEEEEVEEEVVVDMDAGGSVIVDMVPLQLRPPLQVMEHLQVVVEGSVGAAAVEEDIAAVEEEVVVDLAAAEEVEEDTAAVEVAVVETATAAQLLLSSLVPRCPNKTANRSPSRCRAPSQGTSARTCPGRSPASSASRSPSRAATRSQGNSATKSQHRYPDKERGSGRGASVRSRVVEEVVEEEGEEVDTDDKVQYKVNGEIFKI